MINERGRKMKIEKTQIEKIETQRHIPTFADKVAWGDVFEITKLHPQFDVVLADAIKWMEINGAEIKTDDRGTYIETKSNVMYGAVEYFRIYLTKTNGGDTMKQISIPKVVTANTYFWTPGAVANIRRSNEEKRLREVADWLKQMGFDTAKKNIDTILGILEDKHGTIEVEFHYSESARNVYKHFRVRRNGQNSNIKGLINEMKKRGIELKR